MRAKMIHCWLLGEMDGLIDVPCGDSFECISVHWTAWMKATYRLGYESGQRIRNR